MLKRYSYIIVLLAVVSTAYAGTIRFRTAELQRLAKVVALPTASLRPGYNSINSGNLHLVARMDSASTLTHLGISVFSQEMRQMGSQMVFDFLERYFLQLQYPPQGKTSQFMMRDDQVRLTQGTLAQTLKLLPSDAFSCQNQLGRYEVAWTQAGKVVLALSFPAQYELLAGTDKIEAEQMIEMDIKETIVVEPPTHKDSALVPVDYSIRQGGYYLSPELNGNLYFGKTASGDSTLVVSADYPAESCANMMLSEKVSGNFNLSLHQNIYGFNTKEFQVPLRQWVAYCHSVGCQLYFGVQDLKADTLIVSVVAVNTDTNFNHILTARVPLQVIADGEGNIDADLYSYVPTHNVRNLFAKNKKKKKNQKIFIK